jgi:hypothetical protein
MYIGCGPPDEGVRGYVVFFWLSNFVAGLLYVCVL